MLVDDSKNVFTIQYMCALCFLIIMCLSFLSCFLFPLLSALFYEVYRALIILLINSKVRVGTSVATFLDTRKHLRFLFFLSREVAKWTCQT
jgi:hypothetical protein